MPLLEDYRGMMERNKMAEEAKQVQERRATLIPRLTDITHKAQTVVDHLGWQFFLDSLESRVQIIESERARLMTAMIAGPSLGQDLERQKVALNKCDAELVGLRFAATLIPQAVELGHKIAGESARQAAAASIAG